VATQYQRQGLGSLLLIDALQRIVAASELIATRVVDVLASSDSARQWYLEMGFLEFENLGEKPPFHLYLPMDTVRQIVTAAISGA
jgi:ribosomal protein S18 acetylase RimI-like enzyme